MTKISEFLLSVQKSKCCNGAVSRQGSVRCVIGKFQVNHRKVRNVLWRTTEVHPTTQKKVFSVPCPVRLVC